MGRRMVCWELPCLCGLVGEVCDGWAWGYSQVGWVGQVAQVLFPDPRKIRQVMVVNSAEWGRDVVVGEMQFGEGAKGGVVILLGERWWESGRGWFVVCGDWQNLCCERFRMRSRWRYKT
eukprot:scaffold24011_cov304-Cylindrotheca_fusiformis.AAC.2